MANYYFLPRASLNPYAPEYFPMRYCFRTNLQFSPPSPLPAPARFIIGPTTFPPSIINPTSPSFYYTGTRNTSSSCSPQFSVQSSFCSTEFELQTQPLHDFLYATPDLSPEPPSDDAVAPSQTSITMHENKALRKNRAGFSESMRPPRLRKQQDHMNRRRVWKIKSGDDELLSLPGGVSEEKENMEDKSIRVVEYKLQRKRGQKYQVQAVHEDEKKTTLMIRNIPSKYTRDMVLDFLDKYCLKVNQRVTDSCNSMEVSEEEEFFLTAYDFFYMPIDFKSGMNKSYAFVNFSDPRAVWKFFRKCNKKTWEYFQSSKIMEIAIAKYQGKEKLIERFGKTAFACDSDEYLPVCFEPPRDGSNTGELETSTVGNRIPTNNCNNRKY